MENERIAKDIDELIEYWKADINITEEGEDAEGMFYTDDEDGFGNITIDFELSLPFPKDKFKKMQDFLFRNIGSLKFKNCKFLKDVFIGRTAIDIEFTQVCVFREKLKSRGSEDNLMFRNSIIKKIDFEDAVFGKEEEKHNKKGKVRFHKCNLYDVNFRNTTFNGLADFWNSTFYKPTTFYKTDFRDIAVFSAVTFKENILFTYTLIDKLMVLRGTYPEKGFDLSLAIISGSISLFDFQLDDYNSYGKIYEEVNESFKESGNKLSYLETYEIAYENAVSDIHEIPIENKRETYRILKNQLESQKNYIDAIPFKVMESKTHLKESWKKLKSINHTFTRPLSNIIVLSLNAISNWFGSSYIIGIIFTVSIASLFFNGMLSHIGDFVYTSDYSKWQWEYFVKFINPTHRFDFMKSIDAKPKAWFYIYDFLGRIFIGYGIYQTIQAFRKYK